MKISEENVEPSEARESDGQNEASSTHQHRSYKPQRLVDYLTSRARCPRGNIVDLAKNHPPFLRRLNLMKKLPVHEGCVNTICWNKTGEHILSGSDDRNLCITKPTCMFDQTNDHTVVHKIPTHHIGNIFCAQFLPNSCDCLIASCSSDGPVIVHDINSREPSHGLLSYNCHCSTIYEVVTLPDNDQVFLSCSEDKTVRLFDMRCHKSCARPGTCPHPALIRNSHAITTMAVHPTNSNLLLVGRADSYGLVYDRRKLPSPSDFSREKAHLQYLDQLRTRSSSTSHVYLHPLDGVISKFSVPNMEEKCRFTALCFSSSGDQVLASYSQDYVYLFGMDKSSNFELIQTLPKNIARSTSSETEPRSSNLPRVRIRGDWSDTGVNSVPHSERSDNASSQAPNIIQRITEVAIRVRATANQRRVGRMEVDNEGGNEQGSSSAQEAPESAASSNVERIIEEEEGVDEEEERGEADTNDDNDNDQDDEEEEGEDEEAFVDLSSACKKKRTSSGSSGISPEAKLKWSKTFADLTTKYSNIINYHPRVRYQGHRNSITSIKEAIFWGDEHIMSGSDCGRIMIWEKETAKLVMAFKADERVVNCLAPNPHYYALASSGIDYDIKLWSTHNGEETLEISETEMERIMRNNELMLEEARQTVTVPPHLFFRVLASFARNHLN